jgi:topoisomerase-4 subunit A
MSSIEPLMKQNFIEYASYVIVDRAIPDVRDGCKPVQRRILHTLHEMDDGKFHKVANVIGESMKLHPHGDASIGDALVVLANKEYFIEKQGNFGNIITGHSAAAPRYIECRLTKLARECLFNKNLTEFAPSYDGRKKEPVWLPAKLPVLLMQGTEGIAVGMATKILPHCFPELVEAQIAILRKEPVEIYPDFAQGGMVDVSEYDDGLGKVKVRARIEKTDDKTVTITEIPFGTNTEKLIESIETAAQKNKIKVNSINDYTTDVVEIQLELPRGVHADDVIPALYAYTDCEMSISSNVVVIRGDRPHEMRISEVLQVLTAQLKETLQRELEWELSQLQDRHHWLTLEQIFIENRVYKRIEEATTEAAVFQEVYEGMKPFGHLFVRELVDEDVKRLLEIRIRRISAFDINKNRKDIDDIVRAIDTIQKKLGRMTRTTIGYLEWLMKEHASKYPRRTEITSFQEVSLKQVAMANIKVAYDPESGFFGADVKGTQHQFTMSEYDRVLLISDDGSYRIVGPESKILISGKLIHTAPFDEERGAKYTVIYRDAQKNCFGKRVHIEKYIRNREYSLIKGEKGRIDKLWEGYVDGKLTLHHVPAPRQRNTETEVDLATLDEMGVNARGTRLAPKPVAKVRLKL